MSRNLINFLWVFWLFCFIMSIAVILAFLSTLIESLKDKKDKKLFEKVLHGQSKNKGNPILYIDKMTGRQFEIFLKEIFKALGYRVKKTPDSGDFGADLYMEKDGKTYVVQAKRFKSKVGIKSIQEVVAAKSHYNAEYAVVVTNSYFTEAAKTLAKSNGVILIERPDLIRLIEKSSQTKHLSRR